ncbi:uncharacterized protein LOC136717795 [Amia ocellicauda]|uniref:uncharacterized protein LOC136717795 n=1 Tax=Amia ocellicauda TaxID=2972642 RepID=UPI0034638CC2
MKARQQGVCGKIRLRSHCLPLVLEPGELVVSVARCPLPPCRGPLPRLSRGFRLGHPGGDEDSQGQVLNEMQEGDTEPMGNRSKVVRKICIDLRPVLAAANESGDPAERHSYIQDKTVGQRGSAASQRKESPSPQPGFRTRTWSPHPRRGSEAAWLVKAALPPIAKPTVKSPPSPEPVRPPGLTNHPVALVSLSEDGVLTTSSNQSPGASDVLPFPKIILQRSSSRSGTLSSEKRPSLQLPDVAVPMQLLLQTMRERGKNKEGTTCADHLLLAGTLRTLREGLLQPDIPAKLDETFLQSKPGGGRWRSRKVNDFNLPCRLPPRRKVSVTLSLSKSGPPAL